MQMLLAAFAIVLNSATGALRDPTDIDNSFHPILHLLHFPPPPSRAHFRPRASFNVNATPRRQADLARRRPSRFPGQG
jgi:hypothetical protein